MNSSANEIIYDAYTGKPLTQPINDAPAVGINPEYPFAPTPEELAAELAAVKAAQNREETTEPPYLAEALKMAARGVHVFFIPAGQKGASTNEWQNICTADVEKIRALAAANPSFTNYGCVGKAVVGVPFALDDDGGVVAEYEKLHGPLPTTLKAQSCNGGFHYYLLHSAKSVASQESTGKKRIQEKDPHGKGELWSLRMHDSYVIGPGSVVTREDGTPGEYKIVREAPIEVIPDSLLDFLIARYESSQLLDKRAAETNTGALIVEGSRNNTLASIAGRLRETGSNYDEILTRLRRDNLELCAPPLPDSELLTITGSIVKNYAAGGVYPVLFDGKISKAFLPALEPGPTAWPGYFKSISELEKGDVRMMIDNFLPEGITFIGALPGEGKTLLALSIAKALTTGKPFLGRRDMTVPNIVPVLYLIPESGGRAFRARCEKFGITKDRSRFLCRTISEGPTLLLSDPMVLEAVRQLHPVVIADTLIRFSKSSDENSAMQNKQLGDDLIALRQAGAPAVLVAHHSTKAMREKGMSLETVLRGTGDIAAMADAVYGMLRDAMLYDRGNGPNEIDIECVKPRDFTPPLPFRIAASRNTDRTVIGLTAGIVSLIDTEGDFQVVQKDAVQANHDAELVRMIKEFPAITIPELQEATRLTPWVIRKSLDRLGWIKPKGGSKGAQRWARRMNSGYDAPNAISAG